MDAGLSGSAGAAPAVVEAAEVAGALIADPVVVAAVDDGKAEDVAAVDPARSQGLGGGATMLAASRKGAKGGRDERGEGRESGGKLQASTRGAARCWALFSALSWRFAVAQELDSGVDTSECLVNPRHRHTRLSHSSHG